MKASQLIHIASKVVEKQTVLNNNPIGFNLFEKGGNWMRDWTKILDSETEFQEYKKEFNFYGILKYSICLILTIAFVSILIPYHFSLIVFGIPIFYLIEIHFLFLFPNLIYSVNNPILKSFRQTWKLGILKTCLTVMQIGFYMMFGLFNFKTPLKNWYIGCLSIIIWYQIEIRNRTYSSFLD